jgi:hypothetical protein
MAHILKSAVNKSYILKTRPLSNQTSNIWRNFYNDTFFGRNLAEVVNIDDCVEIELLKYNATIDNSWHEILFETEEDMTFFVLKWS